VFRIGEFARFTRVSVKMLRHYDEIGLLPPARVDPHTGYRWYSAAQLPALNRILLLRELGFGLDEIATADVDRAYERREHELRDELDRAAARLRAVRARRRMLAEVGAARLTDVVVRPVEAELVATLAAAGDIGAAFYRLEGYVRRHAARAVRPPMTLLADDGTACVAVPVSWRLPAGSGVSVTELPAVPAMACTVHRGRYGDLGGHLQRMLGWLEETGRQPVGLVREVYLRFGAEPDLELPPVYLTDDADELVTELQVPLSS
jgi:DNA-binding transcriptional MerR regulator